MQINSTGLLAFVRHAYKYFGLEAVHMLILLKNVSNVPSLSLDFII